MSNADLPEGWSMPDDLAEKISEALNNKPISPEDELASALDEMARDIALIEPDPQDWGGRVIYLMEQMEEEAEKRRQINQFEFTLEVLSDLLQNRIKDGKW